jgi:hypothetical protein
LQHYTIKSWLGSCDFFAQWEIESSNDNKEWKTVDSRDAKDLVGASVVKTYECSGIGSRESFRFIRMRQIGENAVVICGAHFFNLQRI